MQINLNRSRKVYGQTICTFQSFHCQLLSCLLLKNSCPLSLFSKVIFPGRKRSNVWRKRLLLRSFNVEENVSSSFLQTFEGNVSSFDFSVFFIKIFLRSGKNFLDFPWQLGRFKILLYSCDLHSKFDKWSEYSREIFLYFIFKKL